MKALDRIVVAGAAAVVLLIMNLGLLRELARFTWQNDFASQIALVPLIAAFLVLRKRREILPVARWSPFEGGVLVAAGLVALALAGRLTSTLNSNDALSLRTFFLIFTLVAIFVFCYGLQSLRTVLFPAAFLLLAVPIPLKALDSLIELLRAGSADAAARLFWVTGTPFFREGAAFSLPGVAVEVARQCSGIRSSLALFITSLLAAHLMLDRGWSRCVLVLLSVPMAMIKNGVRIVVLSLLAIHVDMRFLTSSSLHRDGGLLFFMLALLLMAPMLAILRKLERRGLQLGEAAAERARAAEACSLEGQRAGTEGWGSQ